MRKIAVLIFFVLIAFVVARSVLNKGSDGEPTLKQTEDLTNEILVHGRAYSDLSELVAIGSRLSGSANASKAVEWAKSKMESYNFDRITLQPMRAPKWERGPVDTAVAIVGGQKIHLNVAALGGSIGTPESGVDAEVIEVQNIDEVSALGAKAKDKIIFYNRPMDPSQIVTFDAYAHAVDQRTAGASRAALQGAVAVIVRSMSLKLDDHPHTGMVNYKGEAPKIPAVAVSTNDADNLSQLLKKDPALRVQLKFSTQQFEMVDSYNVIGEITGSVFPNEFVVVAGHLDSWDLGPGAQDDGAGVVQSIEVLRSIHALGLKPKRSIRAVLFMSEEFGGMGGDEYAKQVKLKNEKHIAAIESDRGGFAPRGFMVKGEPALHRLHAWAKYFAPIYADSARAGHAGTDIEPLENSGAALFGLDSDSQRYFDYHHAATDTLDAVNPRELSMGAAAMAILSLLAADQ